MIKHKVMITTNHPASYMDVLFRDLSQSFDLTILYNKRKSVEKLWKKQNFMTGHFIPELTKLVLLKKLMMQDFIVIGGWSGKVNLLLILILIMTKKEFAVFSDVPDDKHITLVKILFKKVFFNFIPYFFVTGESGIEHFQKFYNIKREKFKIFPYTIEMLKNEEMEPFNQARQEILLNKKNEKIRIFIANRFIERKGYDTLFEALVELKKIGILDKYSIKIAGSGNQYDEYYDKFLKLDPSIELLNWIEVEHYKKLLKSMDVFIHASFFEPYGIPVLDVMAHGKLIIASDGVMSALDHIRHGENGYLFTKGNEQELYEILKNIALDSKLIYQIGKKARIYSRVFSTDINIDSITEVIA